MKLENARYSKIALTLKLTLSVPVNTVSFSTGSFFFFFFHILLFIFQVFPFQVYCLHFYFWRHERLRLVTRAPTIGDTSTLFWVITQQILISVHGRHQVVVDDLADGYNLIYVGLREGVRHTFVGPQRTQASGHSAHHDVRFPVVSSQTTFDFIQVRQTGVQPKVAKTNKVLSKLPWS